MNNLLRLGIGDAQKLRPVIELLRAAVDRLPPFAGDVERREAMSAARRARFVDGAINTEAGFVSTALPGSEVFAHRPILMLIRSVTGREIIDFSAFPEQNEILFKPGTAFRVLKILEQGDETVMELEEVASEDSTTAAITAVEPNASLAAVYSKPAPIPRAEIIRRFFAKEDVVPDDQLDPRLLAAKRDLELKWSDNLFQGLDDPEAPKTR